MAAPVELSPDASPPVPPVSASVSEPGPEVEGSTGPEVTSEGSNGPLGSASDEPEPPSVPRLSTPDDTSVSGSETVGS